MEPLKASMIPTTVDSFAPNGSEAIASSDPSRRTSNSFTIRTTGIVSSRGKLPCRSSKKTAHDPFSRLPGTNYPRSARKSRREPFPSFVSSAATGNWISLENLFPFPSRSFILMSGLKSPHASIRSSSTMAMNRSRPSLTNYRHGWTQTRKISLSSLDRRGHQRLVWDLLRRQKKSTNRVFFINKRSSPGSYPQPLRSPAPEGRRSGAMDNFRSGSKWLTMFCYIKLLQKS